MKTKEEKRLYDQQRYAAKKLAITERNRKWRAANKGRVKELTTAWRKANPDRWVCLVRKWQRSNPQYQYLANVKRRAAKGLAMPTWANTAAITEIYQTAKSLGMEVDHIVPLRSSIVCGLHWEGNLRIVSKSTNSRKGNRLWEEMP